MIDRTRTPREQELFNKYKNYNKDELRKLDDELLCEMSKIKSTYKSRLYCSLADKCVEVLRERRNGFGTFRSKFANMSR